MMEVRAFREVTESLPTTHLLRDVMVGLAVALRGPPSSSVVKPYLLAAHPPHSNRRPGWEHRLALLLMRRQAFLHLRASEAEELQRQRRIERRTRLTQPVVQGVFGEANGALRAFGQACGDLDRLGIEFRSPRPPG